MDRVPEWIVLAPMLAAAMAVATSMAGAIFYDACAAGAPGRGVEGFRLTKFGTGDVYDVPRARCGRGRGFRRASDSVGRTRRW
jgi:hypothetical protein